jgi:hypothetical protein
MICYNDNIRTLEPDFFSDKPLELLKYQPYLESLPIFTTSYYVYSITVIFHFRGTHGHIQRGAIGWQHSRVSCLEATIKNVGGAPFLIVSGALRITPITYWMY